MQITFEELNRKHFALLLSWLENPHVKEWWDKDITYNDILIDKKYTPYTQGFKILGKTNKPMHAFIIKADGTPIGYIQYYDKHDFPPEQGYDTEELPKSLAAIDFYIGEKDYLGKGLGLRTLQLFLKEHVFKYFKACFVDPDTANKIAIDTYKKAEFKIIKETPELEVVFMINYNL